MEKLKQAKHNHLLTDWLKVGIFALLLLLPFFVFAPTAFYYGFNEHATAPTKQVENTTTIHMQQNVINGMTTSLNNWYEDSSHNIYYNSTYNYIGLETFETDFLIYTDINLTYNQYDKILCKINFEESDLYSINISIDSQGFGDSVEFGTNVNASGLYTNIFQIEDTNIPYIYLSLYCDSAIYGNVFACKQVQLFNLTQMFGSGNEPTIDEFNTLFPNDYYAYDSQETAEWPNGTYTTYTDISSTMSFAWESMFDTPLLKWTKNSPFKTSINGFLTLFQIPQQSGIGLYLNYLITMVCIYVVFDIVIQLFKWITHIIGEK